MHLTLVYTKPKCLEYREGSDQESGNDRVLELNRRRPVAAKARDEPGADWEGDNRPRKVLNITTPNELLFGISPNIAFAY